MIRIPFYKAALTSPLAGWLAAGVLAVVALGAPPALAAGEFRVHGVVVPGGAARIGEDRYRLPEGFDATMKFYKGIYKPDKFRRRMVINQPGIKAVHVDNPDREGEWDGFNIYEYQGEVRIYVLSRKAG